MAPSAMVRHLLGNTSSGSTSRVEPSPVQVGHAPCGLLKLKSRGSISGKFISHSAQANFSEKGKSFSPIVALTAPLPILRAVSRDSRMRERSISGPRANLSTTISKSCFFFFSAYHRSQNEYLFALGQFFNGADNLVYGLSADSFAALGTMRFPYARK